MYITTLFVNPSFPNIPVSTYRIINTQITIVGALWTSPQLKKKLWSIYLVMPSSGIWSGNPAPLTRPPSFEWAVKINNIIVPTQNVLACAGGYAQAEDVILYDQWTPDFFTGTTGLENQYYRQQYFNPTTELCILNYNDVLNLVVLAFNNDPANSWTGAYQNFIFTFRWEIEK
jgi:hypothetical protein